MYEKQWVSAAIALPLIVMGANSAAVGPLLSTFAERTGVELAAAAFIFPVRSVANLIGSLVGGAVVDKNSDSRIVGVFLMVGVVTTLIMPFTTSLTVLVGLNFVNAVVGGYFGTVSNVIVVWVHGVEKVSPYMQLLHFCWAVGAFLSPMVVQAFRATNPMGVYYATSAIGAVGAVAFSFTRVKHPEGLHAAKQAGKGAGVVASNWSPTQRVRAFLEQPSNAAGVTAAVLLGCYVAAEISFGGFVFTYSSEVLAFSAADADYVTALYWAGLTAGRGLSIFISLALAPDQMLLGDVIGASLAMVAVVATGSRDVLWVAACAYGLCMASIFPCVVTQVGKYFQLTGRWMSAFCVGAAVGEASLPLMLQSALHPGRFGYIMTAILVDTLVMLVCLLVMLAVGRRAMAQRLADDLSSSSPPTLLVDAGDTEVEGARAPRGDSPVV